MIDRFLRYRCGSKIINNNIYIKNYLRQLQFLKRLVILIFHLVSLSLAVYLRPGYANSRLMAWPEDPTDVARTIAEAITVLGVLSYILVQLGGEVVNIGPLSFLRQLVSLAF